jgi:prepilin-type N-terminal cleavage/methylation domain-containing protein
MSTKRQPSRSAFTLIELLVVIAIIAILSVVVILTLNPAELLRESRDANRVSDMSTLNTALGLYANDQSGSANYSLGTPSTTYLSVPDPSATSTAGDQCQGLGMPALPTSTSYGCTSSSSLRNVSSTGWIPVNFKNISSGSPIGSLPVDPTNQTSSNLYYTYATNGRTYKLTAFFESQKYAPMMANDGGPDYGLYETGNNLTLPDPGRGLVANYTFQEGPSSSYPIDTSGYDQSDPANENVYGISSDWWSTPGGSYGTLAKVGKYAVYESSSSYYTDEGYEAWLGVGYYNDTADGSDSHWEGGYIPQLVNSSDQMCNLSISTWSYYASPNPSDEEDLISDFQNGNLDLVYQGNYLSFIPDLTGHEIEIPGNFENVWTMTTLTMNSSTESVYVNGKLADSVGMTGCFDWSGGNEMGFGIGDGYNDPWVGSISDIRFYNRTLPAAEIQELYNAEK